MKFCKSKVSENNQKTWIYIKNTRYGIKLVNFIPYLIFLMYIHFIGKDFNIEVVHDDK